MGLFKHIVTKSIDTHFDKKVAANVGVNATKMQQQAGYQYQSAPNNPNIKIANPQLYANWQAQQRLNQMQSTNNSSKSSSQDIITAKKAELMTELIKQGKTPEEALEFANKALGTK